jgi:hypothetical protein
VAAAAAAAVATAGAFAAIYAFGGGTRAADHRQGEMQAITRAVFADGRLWLLRDDGSLVSLKPDAAEPERVTSDGKVADICKADGRLVAVVESGKRWTLRRLGPEGWTIAAAVPIDGDTLAAIDCKRDAGGITLVTNRRLIDVDGVSVRSVTLRQETGLPLVNATALVAGDTVWVGSNVGEWGGGLRRLSRSDGTVKIVEQNNSGVLCGGPLNTACDPVTGIVAAPWNPSCVVAAIGLVHMMAQGRIVEVCGERVRRLYFKPLDPQPPNNRLDEGEPGSTIAFFGLDRAGTTLWAIGIDGLYRFDGAAAPTFQPLPRFDNRGGYRVSFAVPGIVLVLTDVNQRRSVSGSVPIMAVR